MTPAGVCRGLVEAFELDQVGPDNGTDLTVVVNGGLLGRGL
jgi:hypothetical protein